MILKNFHSRELALCASPLRFKCGLETLAVIGIATAAASAVGGTASAIASSNAQKSVNEANALNVANTNATNLQIARETNEQNRELVEQQNEYNSIGAQIQRGREAGVNPNSILGGNIAGNLQTEVPKMIAPIMQAFQQARSPMADFSQTFQQISQGAMAVEQSRREMKSIDYKTALDAVDLKWQDFLKQFQSEQAKWNIEGTKEQIRLWGANAAQSWQNVTLMRQTGRYLQALGAGINADNYDKFMRNVFSFDMYKFGVEHLKSQVFNNFAQGNQAETMAKISMEMLPANLGLVRANTFMFNSQGSYYKSLESLTPANKSMLFSLAGLYDSQSFNNFLDSSFKIDSYDFRLQFEKERVPNIRSNTYMQNQQGHMYNSQHRLNNEIRKRYEWQNSTTYRFLEANEMFARSAMMYGSAYSDFTGGKSGLGSLFKKAPKIGF